MLKKEPTFPGDFLLVFGWVIGELGNNFPTIGLVGTDVETVPVLLFDPLGLHVWAKCL